MAAELIINVTEVEELQMISNRNELDKLFAKAKSTIVQGGIVILGRKSAAGIMERFDEISTEQDLAAYRNFVFKYL